MDPEKLESQGLSLQAVKNALGGKDVVALEIQRQTGGNTLAMVTAKDNARFIIDNVDDVNVSIYVGGLLTVIIVFFFLKSRRSTLIVVPVFFEILEDFSLARVWARREPCRWWRRRMLDSSWC